MAADGKTHQSFAFVRSEFCLSAASLAARSIDGQHTFAQLTLRQQP